MVSAPRLAAAAAVILITTILAPIDAALGGDRDETTHVLVGVASSAAFEVSAAGSPIPASPVDSDSLGILAFTFDDPGLPTGSLLMSVGPPGEPAPLEISGIHAAALTETSAVIAWTTDRAADAVVEYGRTASYGLSASVPEPLATDHSVAISGLESATVYHFRVRSTDGEGIEAISDDSTFETLEPPPPPLEIIGAGVADGDTTWARIVWATNRPAASWVEYGLSSSYGSSTALDAELVTDHDVLVTGLSPGTLYHFRAAGVDAAADTAWSDDLTFETPVPPPPPLVVDDVTVAAVDTTTARITWTTNRPSDSLVEYGETASYGSSSGLDADQVVLHDVTITGLEPGTVYHFRVRSDDGAGDVAYSEDGGFETDNSPLALMDVTVVDVGTSWAEVSWATSRPSTSIVECGVDTAYGTTVMDSTAATLHRVLLEGLEEETLYHFRVSSVDVYGMTAASGDSTFETKGTGPMGGPIITGVETEPLSMRSVVVSWSTDRPSTAQVLYGVGDSLDCCTPVVSEPSTEHRVVVQPVVPRIEYRYVVQSACGSDTSQCDARTFQTTAPAGGVVKTMAPQVAWPPSTLASDTTAVVRWTVDRPCTTWLEWGVDTTYGHVEPGRPAWRLRPHVYEAALESLEGGATYHCRVVAVGARGDTTTSADAIIRTTQPAGGSEGPDDPAEPDTEPPPTPDGVVASRHGRDIRLDWNAVDAADLAGYRVYRARVGAEPRAERLNEVPITSPWYLDRSVVEGTYAYTVASVDSAGNESGPSGPAVIEFSFSAEHRVLLSAYPNPSRGEATFSFAAPAASDGAVLRVYSVDGRLVREIRGIDVRSGATEVRWDGRDGRGRPAGSGIYLCELSVGRLSARQKLTVLR